MKAYWIAKGAEGTNVELRDVTMPEPKAGELVVRVRATSLNRIEFMSGKPGAPARAAGSECAGDVVSIGEGVTTFAKGDRVMGRAPGAFAEYATIDVRDAMRVPANMRWEDAAAIPIVFVAAYDMLVAQGELTEGQCLLVTAISSGVGVASLGLAKALGARVIGTSRSADKLARLQKLGLDVGIHARGDAFSEAALKATDGKGAHLVVNTVGGSVFAECVRSLAFEGRLATVGFLDRQTTANIDLDALHAKRLRVFGVSNRMRTVAQRAATVRAFERDVLPRFGDGKLRPIIDKVFGWKELPAAVKFMESDAQVGKLVVTLD